MVSPLESLDLLEHVSGGSCPLPLISVKSLIDKLGDHDRILHIELFDAIHEATHDAAIV